MGSIIHVVGTQNCSENNISEHVRVHKRGKYMLVFRKMLHTIIYLIRYFRSIKRIVHGLNRSSHEYNVFPKSLSNVLATLTLISASYMMHCNTIFCCSRGIFHLVGSVYAYLRWQ